MTVLLCSLILLGVLIASTISGIFGMVGDTLLLLMIGVAMLPLPQTLVLYGTALFVAGISRSFIHRRYLRWNSIEYYLAGFLFLLIFGSLPTIALDRLSQDFLRGAGYLLAGISFYIPLLSQNKLKPDFSQPPQALLCSVVVNGFNSLDDQGFLVNMFFQDVPMTRHEVISTKAVAQLVPYSLVLMHAGSAILVKPDILTPMVIGTCLAIVPTAVFGSAIATRLLARITDVQFYKITRIILWAMGAIYIGRAALILMQAVPELTALKTQ